MQNVGSVVGLGLLLVVAWHPSQDGTPALPPKKLYVQSRGHNSNFAPESETTRSLLLWADAWKFPTACVYGHIVSTLTSALVCIVPFYRVFMRITCGCHSYPWNDAGFPRTTQFCCEGPEKGEVLWIGDALCKTPGENGSVFLCSSVLEIFDVMQNGWAVQCSWSTLIITGLDRSWCNSGPEHQTAEIWMGE